MILVDTNVLLDVVTNDPVWANWSQGQLDTLSLADSLAINAIVYSELSVAFKRIEDIDQALTLAALKLTEIPREALFLAGKVFAQHRRRRGAKVNVLPDFFVGAHAAVMEWPLLTRDAARYQTYFPTVQLISPKLGPH